MADLVVELYGTRVGTLTSTWRTFDFVSAPGAVEVLGIDSPVLSVTIPLTAVGNLDMHAKEPLPAAPPGRLDDARSGDRESG